MAAYNGRDVDQLKSVWPSLGKKEQQIVAQSFKAARSIRLDLTPVSPPQMTGDTALVTCKRNLQMQDERGAQQKIADTMTLRLRKQSSVWVIDGLQ
jgi:hypothetical protein